MWTQEPNSWSSQDLVNIIVFTLDVLENDDDHHDEDDAGTNESLGACRWCRRPAVGVWPGTRYGTCSYERDSVAVGTNILCPDTGQHSWDTVTQTPVVSGHTPGHVMLPPCTCPAT